MEDAKKAKIVKKWNVDGNSAVIYLCRLTDHEDMLCFFNEDPGFYYGQVFGTDSDMSFPNHAKAYNVIPYLDGVNLPSNAYKSLIW